MAATGLGQDGYLRIQKETTWGTAVNNSMVLLPVKPDALISASVEQIERDSIISSRLKQAPNSGRTKVTGTIPIEAAPSSLGLLFNLLLGASSNGTVSDSTYDHTFLVPITGERVGKGFTAQQAIGADLAQEFAGCTLTKLKLTVDNQKNLSFSFDMVGKTYTEGVARISSFSYPTESPYNFSHVTVNIDPLLPANDAAFDQICDGLDLELDLAYDLERFKVGSKFINQPVFTSIPKLSLKLSGNDAEQKWATYARALQTFKIVITILHTEYAAGTTPFRTVFEIPTVRLKSETVVPNANDLVKMDLDFEAAYGGTTTGGGSTPQIMEVRHRDATATYP